MSFRADTPVTVTNRWVPPEKRVLELSYANKSLQRRRCKINQKCETQKALFRLFFNIPERMRSIEGDLRIFPIKQRFVAKWLPWQGSVGLEFFIDFLSLFRSFLSQVRGLKGTFRKDGHKLANTAFRRSRHFLF